MARLDDSDRLHLEAARGWLGLSDWREASDELDRITPTMRAHPSVLRTRILVCIAAEKWDLMHEIAQALLLKLPYDALIFAPSLPVTDERTAAGRIGSCQ